MAPGSATAELLDALAELGFDVPTGVEPTALEELGFTVPASVDLTAPEELGFAAPASVDLTAPEELDFVAPLLPPPHAFASPVFAPPWPPPSPATIVTPMEVPERPRSELAAFVAAVPLLPVAEPPQTDRVAPQLPPMPREPMPAKPLDAPVRVGAAPWVASAPPWETAVELRPHAPATPPPPPVIRAPQRRSKRPVVLAGLAAFVIGFGAGWGTNWLAGGHGRLEIAPSVIAPAVIAGQTMVSRNVTSAAGSFTMTPWA
jgi:hypothetical protein